MKELILSSNLEIIENNAFYGNLLEGEIVIPAGVKVIGRNAFQNNRFKKVILPNSLESLGGQAFRQSITIDTIVIGDNVTIDNDPFPSGFFQNVYERNNKRGGTYILRNNRYERQ